MSFAALSTKWRRTLVLLVFYGWDYPDWLLRVLFSFYLISYSHKLYSFKFLRWSPFFSAVPCLVSPLKIPQRTIDNTIIIFVAIAFLPEATFRKKFHRTSVFRKNSFGKYLSGE